MTLAQVGATFAGFAAIIGAFQESQDPSRSRWIIRDIVEISLMVTIFSFVPVIVNGVLSHSDVWRTSCGIVAFSSTIGWAASLHRNWKHWTTTPLILVVVTLLASSVIISCWMAASRQLFTSADMVYLISMLTVLSAAGFMFVYLLTDKKEIQSTDAPRRRIN